MKTVIINDEKYLIQESRILKAASNIKITRQRDGVELPVVRWGYPKQKESRQYYRLNAYHRLIWRTESLEDAIARLEKDHQHGR